MICKMPMEHLADTMWILSSEKYLKAHVLNKPGKNTGKRSIWFNGNLIDPETGERKEYCKERFK